MKILAKALVSAKYAGTTGAPDYAAASGARAILDKFTATNTHSSAITLTVNIVPAGGVVDSSNRIVSGRSINAGEAADLSELKNQVLNPGDFLAAVASVGAKLVIRVSGREIT